jgi:glycosyltransferase involved in cell wall biosynthesis
LYEAWSRIDAPVSTLVFVGATESRYKEVDPAIAEQIRRKVEANGQRQAVRFVAPTLAIEKYYRAADVYVLPSQREGLPIALLEAMSSGLACVATRLPGSTDSIIEDGTSGRLVDADDPNGYSDAIAALLRDRDLALRLGAAARARALARYSIRHTAEQWLAAYREVVGDAQH